MTERVARPHCPGCGHFRSHEPRTDNLSSGRCPDCPCLSGWQSDAREKCPNCKDGVQKMDDGFAFTCGACKGTGWLEGYSAEIARGVREEVEAEDGYSSLEELEGQ